MASPTTRQLLDWAGSYVALWNAGDKPGWVRNWRSVAPGEFRMLDPVGTPEKLGFESCALEPWDLFQSRVKYRIVDGSLLICANEVAWFLENHISADGRSFVGHSIETYRFEPNGDVLIRTYYQVPAHDDGSLGELFKTYLPDGQ